MIFNKIASAILGRYEPARGVLIVTPYFNPQKSRLRLEAFKTYYNSIKHLDHVIVEGVMSGHRSSLQDIVKKEHLQQVQMSSYVWQKEALINSAIGTIMRYKYVFWVDGDVLFENRKWLSEACRLLEEHGGFVQPFGECQYIDESGKVDSKWTLHSFGSTRGSDRDSCDYYKHGHVGMAWGTKTSIFIRMNGLYDRALIGGADHVMAHGAAKQPLNECIRKAFSPSELEKINEWQTNCGQYTHGVVSHVPGVLKHMYHGPMESREYLKRVREFSSIDVRPVLDASGTYRVSKEAEKYFSSYMNKREVVEDDGFLTSMAVAYATDDTLIGYAVGGNMMGAIIGDELNEAEKNEDQFS